MSSRSSKKNSKNKNRSGSASETGSVKEFVEKDADEDTQQVVTASEPTSAETKPIPDSSVVAPDSESHNFGSRDPAHVSPTSSVYGEVFKEDPPSVQVAILEPEIAVATPAALPQEPIPIQENSAHPNSEGGWFSSLFACCVSRK